MKRYFRSRYVKKNTLSAKANKHLVDDLALFSKMRLEAFVLEILAMQEQKNVHFRGRFSFLHTICLYNIYFLIFFFHIYID